LTSFSEPAADSDSPSETPRAPTGPQRALSSASLNLLLPSTSRLTERTPLLIPVTETPEGTIPIPYSALSSISPPASGSGIVKGRLLKRTSTSDFTPTLGISSQAGFLLMATTPPTAGFPSQAIRRGRSSSRSQVPVIADTEHGSGMDRAERGERMSPERGTGRTTHNTSAGKGK